MIGDKKSVLVVDDDEREGQETGRVLPEERRTIERELVDEYGQALAEYGVDVDADQLWLQYRRDAYAGIVMSVIASQIVGVSDRSEAMFAAMAARHSQHALDLESESLL